MKSIILDSGPVITLALNNLLWLLEKAKEKYKINFFITEAVKREVIDNPFNTKKFKFESLQVMHLLDEGILELITNDKIKEKTYYLMELANSSYRAKGHFLNLVHYAELSAVSASLLNMADAVMIDERTTRYMIEKPVKLRNILRHKLHTNVEINKTSLLKLKEITRSVKFIRSAEFVTVAFEKNLLDEYLPNVPDAKRSLLEALLWGLKLNGCSISNRDLDLMLKLAVK